MKKNKITTVLALLSLMVLSTFFVGNVNTDAIPVNTNDDFTYDSEAIILDYEVPELPDEEVPEWEINITGIGITELITLNLSYLIDQINTSNLNAYEETVDYKGSNQTIIGFDILQVVQDYADVWYAGEFEFIAEDGYSKSLNATDILYSYYPPALENADIKILLAFAVNGSYLPNSDWAHKGALRLVCPSNQKNEYPTSYWVGNVTDISITDKWKCNVFVNGELETSIPVGFPSEFPDYEYLSYDLTYHSENIKFEGPSILSIFEHIGVDFENITLFQAEAPDFLSTIDKTELTGEKPAILALAANDEYFGFTKGPIRLVGGNLNSWSWLKNCFAIHITVSTESTTPTSSTPGFSSCLVILSLLAIPITYNISKKRK